MPRRRLCPEQMWCGLAGRCRDRDLKPQRRPQLRAQNLPRLQHAGGQRRGNRPASLSLPHHQLPVTIPISVRSATDYGLEFKVSGIPQEMPLRFANFEDLGIARGSKHDPSRFFPGPGNPPGWRRRPHDRMSVASYAAAGIAVKPSPTTRASAPGTVARSRSK